MAAVALTALTSQLAAAAVPPEPTYATATVDGSPAEWQAGDQWGTIVSNDPPMRTVASASLRYDCTTKVLFVLVLASPGEKFQTADPAEAYVRLGPTGKLVSGASGEDGTAPDFAWVDASNGTARGFEASASVEPGAHPGALRIHGKMPNDSADGYETIDLKPRYSDLTLTCVDDVTATSTSTTTSTTSTTSTSTTTSTTTTTTTTTSTVLDPGVRTAATVPPTDPPAVARVTLARTGTPSGPLAAVGIGLVLVGCVLVRRARSLAT